LASPDIDASPADTHRGNSKRPLGKAHAYSGVAANVSAIVVPPLAFAAHFRVKSVNGITLTHGTPNGLISSHGTQHGALTNLAGTVALRGCSVNHILALLVSICEERLDGPYVSNEHLLKIAQDAVGWTAQKQTVVAPTSRAPEHSTRS
jgi:hypothetical protein